MEDCLDEAMDVAYGAGAESFRDLYSTGKPGEDVD